MVELANHFISQTLVKSLRIRVERRYTYEHVRGSLKNVVFRESEESGTQTLVAMRGGNANGLDVADERTGEIQDDEADYGIRDPCDEYLARGIGNGAEARRAVTAEPLPRVRRRHHLGAYGCILR